MKRIANDRNMWRNVVKVAIGHGPKRQTKKKKCEF